MKKLFDNVKLQIPHFSVEIRPTSFLTCFSIKIYKTRLVFDIPSVIFKTIYVGRKDLSKSCN